MSMTEGFVEKIHTKTGNGKKGPWTRYSALIGGDWYVVGFGAPDFNEGDSVKIEYKDTQYGKEITRSKVLEADAAPKQSAGGSSGGSTYNPTDRDRGMQWGNSSNVAATLICKMADIEALPLTAVGSKATKAARYNEFMDMYNKLRVELFNDALDIERVLSKVADAGAVEETEPAPLPEPEPSDEVEDEEWD